MTDSEYEFLKRLREAGVGFIAYAVFGQIPLSLEDLLVYLEDPDAFLARHYDVSVEQFLAWRSFALDPHCRATTAKGRFCKHQVDVPFGPSAFVPGITHYCTYHTNHR